MLLKRTLGHGNKLPAGFPPWNVVLQCRIRWQRNGVGDRVTAVLPLD
jgi:transposase